MGAIPTITDPKTCMQVRLKQVTCILVYKNWRGHLKLLSEKHQSIVLVKTNKHWNIFKSEMAHPHFFHFFDVGFCVCVCYKWLH